MTVCELKELLSKHKDNIDVLVRLNDIDVCRIDSVTSHLMTFHENGDIGEPEEYDRISVGKIVDGNLTAEAVILSIY